MERLRREEAAGEAEDAGGVGFGVSWATTGEAAVASSERALKSRKRGCLERAGARSMRTILLLRSCGATRPEMRCERVACGAAR